MNAKNKELNDIQFDTEELKSRFSAEFKLYRMFWLLLSFKVYTK